MKYYCNPLNINYRYQFKKERPDGGLCAAREAADPSMICFKGKYYIFASMTLGVWVSEDLAHWENHRLPPNLPLYDYAPDVRVMGDYVYFSASRRGENCNFYRTKDILNGPYEEIPGTFDFWDPNLFIDDNQKVYFYWGCSNVTPIWGVELDPQTMLPKSERQTMIDGDPFHIGYERTGEDHCNYPRTEEETERLFEASLKAQGISADQIPAERISLAKGMFSNRPFIEGAWVNKFNGKYYLQYACPGTEYNIYGDGVYVSDRPLGPYTLAKNNPFSYKPGGFLPGAGHGSTMEDLSGNLWHTATMRISVNQNFERRVGIWPAGVDEDGELFCNQRYGDWPMAVTGNAQDPWKNPDWFLLSYGKTVAASSFEEGHEPALAADENVQTWWRAATNEAGQWLQMDLGEMCDVHGVQINFADQIEALPEIPVDLDAPTARERYIEEKDLVTRWILEGSADGITYEVIEDKSLAVTDLAHDFILLETGMQLRYLKLTVLEVPYGQKPCVSGLRVFGIAQKPLPAAPEFTAVRQGDLDMYVKIKDTGALGYNILWGESPEKLYHSYMVFGTEQKIGALVKGRRYCVRVDAFNEAGIVEGTHIIYDV